MENISMSNSINYSNVNQLKQLYKKYYTFRRMSENGNYTALDVCMDLDNALEFAMEPLQQRLVKAYLMENYMPLYQLEKEWDLPRMKGVRELDRALERASEYLISGKLIDNTEANRRIEYKDSLKRKFKSR